MKTASFTILEAGMFTLLGRFSQARGTIRYAIVNPDLNLAEFYDSLDEAKASFLKLTGNGVAQ